MVLNPAERARSVLATVAMTLILTMTTGRTARAQNAEPPPGAPGVAVEAPPPPKPVGGHFGIAVPFVTISKKTTSISDQFTILNPIGIGFKVSKRVAVDFETIVVNQVSPWGTTGLVVDPGVIFGFDRLALGLRVAYGINALANIAIVPLVNYGLVDLGGATWFVEAAFPIGYSDHQASLTVVAHTGIGF
jgi:hypothetical protein